MYRAILFDFYGVWGPDNFSFYTERASRLVPDISQSVEETIHNYFLGLSEIQEVADSLQYKFNAHDIDVDTSELIIDEKYISPEIVKFIQYLHGHFIKVGILANLGKQERHILEDLQQRFDLFDTITSPESLGKPLLSPDIFAHALQEIGEPPQDCLVISGNPEYLDFAQKNGIATMQFQGFPKLVDDLKNQIENGLPATG